MPLRTTTLAEAATCFGCGHANPDGFHHEGDLTVGDFIPRPEHDNGFGFLNGGIIPTVLTAKPASVEASQDLHEGSVPVHAAHLPGSRGGPG